MRRARTEELLAAHAERAAYYAAHPDQVPPEPYLGLYLSPYPGPYLGPGAPLRILSLYD